MKNNFFKSLVKNKTMTELEICRRLNVKSGELYHLMIFFALPVFFFEGEIRAVEDLLSLWIIEKNKKWEGE